MRKNALAKIGVRQSEKNKQSRIAKSISLFCSWLALAMLPLRLLHHHLLEKKKRARWRKRRRSDFASERKNVLRLERSKFYLIWCMTSSSFSPLHSSSLFLIQPEKQSIISSDKVVILFGEIDRLTWRDKKVVVIQLIKQMMKWSRKVIQGRNHLFGSCIIVLYSKPSLRLLMSLTWLVSQRSPIFVLCVI